jgi:glycerophosphoryl diester phosphodiesterase
MAGSTKQPQTGFRIVGHRGAKGIAPENTFASFQKALDIGVGAVELDLHVSKDGELVVMHDPNIERTTDGKGEIGDFTVAELKRLNAAAKFAGEVSYPPQQIPTLQEVFDLVKGKVQLCLEIKLRSDNQRYPGIEQMTLDAVRRNNALSNALVSSFDFPTLNEVKRIEPSFQTQVNISVGYLTPFESKGPKAVAQDLVSRGIQWVAINKNYLTPEMFAALSQAKLHVHPWVVNDPAEMWRFVDMGIDVVTSDRPDLLVPAYKQGRS